MSCPRCGCTQLDIVVDYQRGAAINKVIVYPAKYHCTTCQNIWIGRYAGNQPPKPTSTPPPVLGVAR